MHRALLAAALTAALLAPPPVRPLLGPLHTLLSTLWSAPVPKEGCGADPDGRCNTLAPQPPGAETEAGCGADPDGNPKCS